MTERQHKNLWRSAVELFEVYSQHSRTLMGKQSKQSAGLLMFRMTQEQLEVFLVHPGGPFWVKKDKGAWTLPKGEFKNDEEPLAAAQREFHEETGFTANGPYLELGSARQNSGKVVLAWAFAGDCDPQQLISNTCEIDWPPRSGKRMVIPEVDRGSWFRSRGLRVSFVRSNRNT